MASYLGIEKCDTYDEMLQRGISYVVEATNPKATIDILEKTLNKKINVILLSIGALSDEKYYEKIK